MFGSPADNSWLSSYLEAAELDRVCQNFEVWHIPESSAALNTLTHGFFRYFGKFPPPVAARFIQEYHDPSLGPVVDPMAGSGTTLVESVLLGRPAVGLDVNPLSALIARVKTTPVPLEQVEKAWQEYAYFWQAGALKSFPEYIPRDKHLDHWFSPQAQDEIAKTRWFIEHSIPVGEVKDLFTLALAASIRRLSRASNGLGRMFLDPAKASPRVFEAMAKHIAKISPGLLELARLNPQVQVLVHDARQPFLRPGSTNFVLVHPPYFNLYKYSGIYKFEMLWLGFDVARTRGQEVTEGFKVGKKELVARYARDMAQVFKNIYDVLVPGGVCVLMMGDTVLKGERINTTSLTLGSICRLNFQIDKVIIRPPKFTEASYAAAQRRTKEQVGVKLADYLVILRKAPA